MLDTFLRLTLAENLEIIEIKGMIKKDLIQFISSRFAMTCQCLEIKMKATWNFMFGT